MSGVLRWESEWSDVGMAVRLVHPLKLREVRLDKFPIHKGNDIRLEHRLSTQIE